MTVRAIISLIVALPEILRLIDSISKRIEQDEADRKLKDDLKKIDEAFRNGDAQALNDLFANKS